MSNRLSFLRVTAVHESYIIFKLRQTFRPLALCCDAAAGVAHFKTRSIVTLSADNSSIFLMRQSAFVPCQPEPPR